MLRFSPTVAPWAVRDHPAWRQDSAKTPARSDKEGPRDNGSIRPRFKKFGGTPLRTSILVVLFSGTT